MKNCIIGERHAVPSRRCAVVLPVLRSLNSVARHAAPDLRMLHMCHCKELEVSGLLLQGSNTQRALMDALRSVTTLNHLLLWQGEGRVNGVLSEERGLVLPQIDWNHFLLHTTLILPPSRFILQSYWSAEPLRYRTGVMIILMHLTRVHMYGCVLGVVRGGVSAVTSAESCMIYSHQSKFQSVANVASHLFPVLQPLVQQLDAHIRQHTWTRAGVCQRRP